MEIESMGNRLAIILACVFLVIQNGIETSEVVGILFAVIISCLGNYYSGKGVLETAIGGCIAVSYLFPAFVLVYPTLIYEGMFLLRQERWKLTALFGLAAMVLRYFILVPRLSHSVVIGVLLVSALAAWLNVIGYRHGELRRRYIHQRDDTTELTLALKRENRYILEQQDSEIYAATLQERNRIAREIHDNVGHMLSRAILMTGALLAVAKEVPVKEGLSGLRGCLDEAMTNIRQSVHDLHDESIDLEQTIRNLMKDMEQYEIVLEYDMSEYIPRKVKYCFISIVKEGLSNIIKHSSGDQVKVSLIEHPGFYKLSIVDNGCPDQHWQEREGIGLYNIRDRVEKLSGRWNIMADKSGFQIYVSLPKLSVKGGGMED